MSTYVPQVGDVVRDGNGVVWLNSSDEVVNPWTGVNQEEPIESVDLVEPITLLVRDGKPFTRQIDVTFDGPPSHEAPRFIDCHDLQGRGVSIGEWVDLGDHGYWALRVEVPA